MRKRHGNPLIFCYIFVIGITACGSRQDNKAPVESASEFAQEYQEWPMMDQFHMVMAESYHPYADSGNLEPARANAAELALLSSRWVNSEVPSQLDSLRLRDYLNKLASLTRQLEQVADGGDDDELEGLLKESHDIFHEVMEGWHTGTLKLHPDEQDKAP